MKYIARSFVMQPKLLSYVERPATNQLYIFEQISLPRRVHFSSLTHLENGNYTKVPFGNQILWTYDFWTTISFQILGTPYENTNNLENMLHLTLRCQSPPYLGIEVL